MDIHIDTDQICMGFEADTLERQHAHRMRLSDKDLVEKSLTSNRKIRLLVNHFLTRSLSEIHEKNGHVAFILSGVSASNPMPI